MSSRIAQAILFHFVVGNLLEQDGSSCGHEEEPGCGLDPHSEIALSLSSLYLRKGQTEQAAVLAKKAAELAPDKTNTL
jgi:hypothetical protein